MELFISCGTWIRSDDRRVIRYIRSCAVYPNVAMICAATGFDEPSVKHTLRMLRQQEGFIILRTSLLWFDEETLAQYHPTRHEILLLRLLARCEKPVDVRVILDSNRYFDDQGNIHNRFTRREVENALQLQAVLRDRR